LSHPDDDRSGNGDGYVETKMQLFNITKSLQKELSKNLSRKSLEPNERETVMFLLNQSFLQS
jgi:hypothetical protein